MNRAPSGSALLDDLLVKRDQIRARMRWPHSPPVANPPSLSERLAAVDKFCYNLTRKEMLRIKRIICKSDEEFKERREKGGANYPLIVDIQRIVARRFKINILDILAHRRDLRFMRARHIAMYLCSIMTPFSLPEIGRAFRRDHTTILYAVRKTAALVERDEELAGAIEALKWEIESCIK